MRRLLFVLALLAPAWAVAADSPAVPRLRTNRGLKHPSQKSPRLFEPAPAFRPAPRLFGAAPAPRPNPQPASTSAIVDVTDPAFGAVPNDQGDDGPAIQRAIDTAAANARKASNGAVQDRSRVYLPPGWYDLQSGPLYIDWDAVELVGEGAWLVQNGHCPAILVGVPRNDGGKVINTTYRPGGAAIATRGSAGPAYVKFVGGGFDLGRTNVGNPDHYGTVGQFTLDATLTLPRGNGQGQPVFGLGLPGGLEGPWAVWTPNGEPDTLTLSYKTAGQRRQNDPPFQVRVSLAGLDRSRPFNVSFQADLKANRFWAWLNGVRVNADNAGDRRTPGPFLLCNEGLSPFVIGASTDSEVSNNDPNAVADLTVFGLKMTAGLRYKDSPVGSPQLRADNGQPPDQWFRVGAYDAPDLIDALVPGDVTGDPRMVRAFRGCGFFRHPASNRFVKGARVTGLNLRTNHTGIMYGQVLDFTATDVTAEGVRGVSAFSGACSYPLYFYRCKLSGSDAPAVVRWSDAVFRDLVCDTSGNDSLRCSDSSLEVDGMRVWFPTGTPRRVIASFGGQYGGKTAVRGLTVDYEGNRVKECGVLVEQTAYTPGKLILEDITFGSLGPVPIVRLVTWDNTEGNVGWRCTANISDVDCFDTQYTALIEANGMAWHGRAWAPYLSRGMKFTGAGLGAAVAPDLDVKVGK